MAKREALLTLYGSLGSDAASRAERRALFSQLTDGEYLSRDEAVGKGEVGKGDVPRNQLQPEVDAVSAVLAPNEEPRALAPGGDHVLLVELLEALVALATKHSFDDAASFAAHPALNRLAGPLVADPSDTSRLLEVIYQQRDDETLQLSQPRVIGATDGFPALAALAPTSSVSTLAHLQSAVAGQIDLAVGLQPGVGAEPGATCKVRLVPVSFGTDGAYALSFVTTVDPVELPGDVAVQDFIDALFDPSTWPSRHPFWCSMVEEQPGDHAPAAPTLIAAMEAAASVATTAGAQFRQRRVFREAVGTCTASGGQGTWPNTVLVFTDSRQDGQANGEIHHYLEYRLVPGASTLLSLDDGTIQVVESGQTISITVTKMLFFNETEHSSQGELMADYACVSGWADNTRLFLMSWLSDQ